MSLSDCCERDFGTKSLYGVLGVKETATTKELYQAYRKISFLLVPAYAPANRLEEFCRKFKTVSKVHFILLNPFKRQLYDEKGEIDAVVDKLDEFFGTRYWKKIFPHIVAEDIEDFKERYKDSEEEKEDLKNFYLLSKGNMDRLAEIYFAYTAEDEERMFSILKQLIKKKKIPSYDVFVTEPPDSVESRKNKYKKPDTEDDELASRIAMYLRQSRKNMEAHRARPNEEQREAPRRKRRRH